MDKKLHNLKSTDLISFNTEADQVFIAMLTKLIEHGGGISYSSAVRECAFELDVSTETIKRYLTKHTASRAEFVLEKGFVFLRPKPSSSKPSS